MAPRQENVSEPSLLNLGPSDDFRIPNTTTSTHRLLLGTHTSGGAANYLQIAHVSLPNPLQPDIKDYDEDTGEIGGYGGGSNKPKAIDVKFTIVQKIDHPGEG